MPSPNPPASKIKRIADEQPVFPCWLRFSGMGTLFGPRWDRVKCWPHLPESLYTHWHPDQPTAPTEIPADLPAPASAVGSTDEEIARVAAEEIGRKFIAEQRDSFRPDYELADEMFVGYFINDYWPLILRALQRAQPSATAQERARQVAEEIIKTINPQIYAMKGSPDWQPEMYNSREDTVTAIILAQQIKEWPPKLDAVGGNKAEKAARDTEALCRPTPGKDSVRDGGTYKTAGEIADAYGGAYTAFDIHGCAVAIQKLIESQLAALTAEKDHAENTARELLCEHGAKEAALQQQVDAKAKGHAELLERSNANWDKLSSASRQIEELKARIAELEGAK